VQVVERHAPLRAGVVYLAGEDRHLVVARSGVGVDDGPPENGFRPSASVLFRSAAQSFGAAALGVILSGIGADGVDGLTAIVAAGGTTIAQNQESSIVYGMPRAAIAAGASSLILDVGAIAGAIVDRARG
jgi:two-component system chemotaxis response regulator CheB